MDTERTKAMVLESDLPRSRITHGPTGGRRRAARYSRKQLDGVPSPNRQRTVHKGFSMAPAFCRRQLNDATPDSIRWVDELFECTKLEMHRILDVPLYSRMPM